MKNSFESLTRIPEFLKILYSFGRSDIPAAALPSVRIILCIVCLATKNKVDGYSTHARRTSKLKFVRQRIHLESTTLAYFPGTSKEL